MARMLLRLREVMRRTGESKSAIYRGIAAHTFPQPVAISERAVAWVDTEIDDYVEAKIANRAAARAAAKLPAAAAANRERAHRRRQAALATAASTQPHDAPASAPVMKD
jgi:prophage regulatory protein